MALMLIGVILRIWSISFALGYRENTDILRWKDWGRISYLYSLKDTYKPDYLSFGTLSNNMPPGTLYLVSGAYRINIFVSKIILRITHEEPGSNMFLNGTLLSIILRLPSFFFDILIACLLYFFLKEMTSQKKAVFASLLFFLNPIVIYNSAVWGQMDSITTGMMVLAFILVHKKYFIWALLAGVLSLFVKFSLIFLFPILVYAIVVSSKSYRKLLQVIIVSFVSLYVALLPLSRSPVQWFWEYLIHHATGEMQNITAFAFNLWWFFLTPVLSIVSSKTVFEFSEIRLLGSPLISQTFLGIPLWAYAVSLFFLSLIPFVKIWAARNSQFLEPRKLFLFSALVSLLVFMVLPQMHERYMYPVFPFLALAIALGEPFVREFFSLSLLHLVNLLFVWHPMKELLPLYPMMNSPLVQWGISACIVCIALWVYWKSYFRLISEHS